MTEVVPNAYIVLEQPGGYLLVVKVLPHGLSFLIEQHEKPSNYNADAVSLDDFKEPIAAFAFGPDYPDVESRPLWGWLRGIVTGWRPEKPDDRGEQILLELRREVRIAVQALAMVRLDNV